ncbi:MAG: hypothetical protein RLZZ519_2428 [Bacteroidota bacterium]|jgi:hypothetical protein
MIRLWAIHRFSLKLRTGPMKNSATLNWLARIVLIGLMGMCPMLLLCQLPTAAAQTRDLENRLIKSGYSKLFIHYDGAEAHSVFQSDGQQALEGLAVDTSASAVARMFACEIIYAVGSTPRLPQLLQAEIYLRVLVSLGLHADNPWGNPEHLVGLSARVTSLGEAALPALRPLLKNKRLLYYQGPRPRVRGKDNGPRVKDLAASMICAVQNKPYSFPEKAKKRDRWIKAQDL